MMEVTPEVAHLLSLGGFDILRFHPHVNSGNNDRDVPR